MAVAAAAFIHSRRRNRLDPARAESLVYVFSNLSLAEQLQQVGGEIKFVRQAEGDSDADK